MSQQNQSDMIMKTMQVCGYNLMGYFLLEIEQFTGRKTLKRSACFVEGDEVTCHFISHTLSAPGTY